MTLPDGLVVRDAEPGDREAVVAVQAAAFGEIEAPDARTYVDHFGAGAWVVGCDGDRVVSASALLPHTMLLDGVTFPVGQIEYVATDPDYRNRGLVRAQFERHHQRSAAAGHLLQVVGGIPYFYRRLGYGYGIGHPALFLFDRGLLDPADDVVVRRAAATDLDALLALEAERGTDGLRTVRDRGRWQLLLTLSEREGLSHVLVAERRGRVVGWVRLHREPDEHRVYLLPAIAVDPGVVDTLLTASLDDAGRDLLVGYGTTGVFGARLARVGNPLGPEYGFYTRVADPVALLERLRPVLSARLAASRFASDDGEVAISLYESGLAIAYEQGSVVGVRPVPPVLDPTEDRSIGVAPDWFGALVLGRWGATGLAERVDDVLLGDHRDVMDVLFPKRPADVAGDL